MAVVAWEPPYRPLADGGTRAQFTAVALATERAHATGGAAAAAATFLDGVAGDGAWEASRSAVARSSRPRETAPTRMPALTGLDAGGLARIDVPVSILTGTASEPFYAADRPCRGRACPRRAPGALDRLRHTAPISDPEPVAAAISRGLTAAGFPSHSEAQP